MKITKMVVTDESGVEHTFEGTGFVSVPRANTKKTEPYVKGVTASISLEPKDVKGA